MAELADEFLCERLNSKQLLALLFICECRRKGSLDDASPADVTKSPNWADFAERFAARLSRLPEAERVYLIGSHLQSAEEVDLYSDGELSGLLGTYRELLGALVQELEGDPRFL